MVPHFLLCWRRGYSGLDLPEAVRGVSETRGVYLLELRGYARHAGAYLPDVCQPQRGWLDTSALRAAVGDRSADRRPAVPRTRANMSQTSEVSEPVGSDNLSLQTLARAGNNQ